MIDRTTRTHFVNAIATLLAALATLEFVAVIDVAVPLRGALLGAGAQGEHVGIVGLALDAAVPAEVVVGAVAYSSSSRHTAGAGMAPRREGQGSAACSCKPRFKKAW